MKDTGLKALSIVFGFTLFISFSLMGNGKNDFFDFLTQLTDNNIHHPKVNHILEKLEKRTRNISPNQMLDLRRMAAFHLLFSSFSATNGNVNHYWGIPYFWHYTRPNPREQILLIKSNHRLKHAPPPPGFKKYASMAMVDRTPDIFWSDFASEKPGYRFDGIPDFHTFGWCSEREMAFKSWLHFRGYQSQIILAQNHVWTVVEIDPKTGFWIRVDNTFNQFSIAEKPSQSKDRLAIWYNEKAENKVVHQKIQTIQISTVRKKKLMALSKL